MERNAAPALACSYRKTPTGPRLNVPSDGRFTLLGDSPLNSPSRGWEPQSTISTPHLSNPWFRQGVEIVPTKIKTRDLFKLQGLKKSNY